MSEVTKEEKTNQHHHEEEEEASIEGDMLEAIFTRVPLIDLVSTSQVSKSWKLAVSTSLHHFNKIKPWLILHTQLTRPPYSITSHAYDPRSSAWIKIQQPSINSISALRSSHSTLLYMLSPSTFSFSFDPMHLSWHHVDPPLLWRTDPIVAVVGHRVIVAGGTCDFEDDPLAVEMYDMKTSKWDTCESMPAIFKDSAASMWLSTAVNGNKMYVAEKSTGITYRFDPETKSWQGPYNLYATKNLSSCCIGFANDCLILIGLVGDNEKTTVLNSVKLWEIKGESLELSKEIGEMPHDLLEKVRGDQGLNMSSLVVNVKGDLVFIINSSDPEEIVLCELVGGGETCSWNSVTNVVLNDKCRLQERMVFTCADVSLGYLHKAIVAEGRRFSVL